MIIRQIARPDSMRVAYNNEFDTKPQSIIHLDFAS